MAAAAFRELASAVGVLMAGAFPLPALRSVLDRSTATPAVTFGRT
jgi:hypothetical protein